MRRHPAVALPLLMQRARDATAYDPELVRDVNRVLPHLADRAPDDALALVRSLLSHAPLAHLQLQPLVPRRPAEVARLLLDSDEQSRVSFARVAHLLDTELLIALAQRRPSTLGYDRRWLRRLEPGRRAAVFAAAGHAWRDAYGRVPADVVGLLPGAERVVEARRHVALPQLAASPLMRSQYAAFLPWEEARTLLDDQLRDPKADIRAAAWTALVGCLRYQRDRVPELLAMVGAHRHEQDPVRGAWLTALANLPPVVWQAAHLDALGGVLRDALDGADLSPSSAVAAEWLVVGLAARHVDWSAAWLATLLRERGALSSHDLGDRLTEPVVRRLAPTLLPVLRAWLARGEEASVLAVAGRFGRRLRASDELTEMVETLARTSPNPATGRQALHEMTTHRRERVPALIPLLLKEDRTWGVLPAVYTYLHRRRQDLLTPYLAPRDMRGRFATRTTRLLPVLTDGFHRWTASQQATFAGSLRRIILDADRDSPQVFQAIRQEAALPAVPHTILFELAREERPAVRDAALRALGTLDAGEGLPVLLDSLAGDGGRVAIYALRSSLVRMPSERAVQLLRQAPLERVTVAKEVVRLLGELHSSTAYAELLALDARELHRDVRVALLRALWDHTANAASWDILDRAAASPDAALAAAAGQVPAERVPPATRPRLLRLLVALLDRPEPALRRGVLDRLSARPLFDPERVLLPSLLRLTGSPLRDETTAAATAVFSVYTSEADAPLVGDTLRRLLPDRRALFDLTARLKQTGWSYRGRLLPAARAALAALAADPLTAQLRVELAMQFLPGEELAGWFAALAQSGELHAEALMSAVQALAYSRGRITDGELFQLEQALVASPDERLRRLALAALCAQEPFARVWSAERHVRLAQMRTDPAPLVAAAAQFTFPPDDGT